MHTAVTVCQHSSTFFSAFRMVHYSAMNACTVQPHELAGTYVRHTSPNLHIQLSRQDGLVRQNETAAM